MVAYAWKRENMKDSNYFNLDGKYFRAVMKSFDDNSFKKLVYFQFIRTYDGSVYAKMVGSNEELPIYFRTSDKMLKGYLMHDDYSRYYIESPFEVIVSDNGLFATDEFAPYCQARTDVIDFIELSYKVNYKKKTR